jgi:hypothetical protein
MGEVEPDNIDSGANHFFDNARLVGAGAESGDYFRVANHIYPNRYF